jgi:serine-type D-Ala-D-Ala carboxypeptidase/endopeptidase (penicillin-binding protein 4)
LGTAVRWLPVAVLAVVTAAAAVVVLQSEGPPSRLAVDDDRVETPVLSVRRSLDPLLRRSADARLVEELEAFVATQPADTCLTVRTGDVDFEHRADDAQSPASLEKLLTATAALIELGGDATYETKVLGRLGEGGVVDGNLFLQGGGDPILATAPYVARERNQPQIFSDFARVADLVVAAGVRTVTGSVVGDDLRYDDVRYNPLWPSRFLAQGQVGPLSALSVNDGFAFFPDVDGAFGAAPDPAQYAAQVLTDELRARGVQVVADPVAGATPAGLEALATHESPPLTDIVAQMLQESDNNTAELVLKELGVARADAGTFSAGLTAVASILAEAGLDVEDAAIADGSGLAEEDQLTCDLVVDTLDLEATSDVIAASLAVAGESGTLSRRWLGTDLVGEVRAKTGTLNQVTGLAGHATTADEGDARFSLIVNLPPEQFVDAEIVAGQERLAEILTAHPVYPDVDAFRPRAPDGS